MKYFHKEIEAKWQKYWAEHKTFAAHQPTTNVTPSVVEGQQPKYYVLDMFPYPSGAGLHVGHPLGYIASDIVARYKRHKGYNVLHPQGYDSFGLPAEQYAIQTGQHPEKTTRENIARYREQLDKIGFSFDWDREVRTSNPDYYKHTQWIFIQLFNSWYNKNTDKAEDITTLISVFEKEGNANVNAACDDAVTLFSAEEWNRFSSEQQQKIVLQYRLTYLAETEVNWCPALGTVLANDEIVNGVSERGGHPVVRKKMKQWSMRISAYAERLLQGLETIDWSESIKEAQRNWIGKSVGASVKFKVISQKSKEEHSDFRLLTFDYIEVFTTRPDTIFGVTFMTLAPEHELVAQITTPEQKAAVEAYIDATAKRSERERMADVKTISGVFTGAYAEHPFTKEPIPIWLGDYVLAGYGTGAVMAVPCGDERDYAFAKHFDIAIKNIFNLTPNPSPTERGAMHSQEASEQKSDFYNDYHYLSANPTIAKKLVVFARENRKNFTEAEDVLWQELRNRKLDDKFRRQHYIGNFIVDFACLSKQLIIEIDGEIHNHSIEYDSERTNILNEIGFQVIRFSNNEVLQQTEKVLNTIKEALKLRPDFSKIEKTPSPTERGQGGEVLQAYTEKQNFTFINSDFLNGLDYQAGTQTVIEELEKIGAGKAKVNYRLRDAVFSRQRYWGEPFPVYYVNGLPQMIDAQHLPIVLPEVEKYLPTEDGQPPLGNATHWAWDTKSNTVVSSSAVENKTIFPLELNTMPGWAGSSWYWMRYMDAHNQNEFASKEALSYWENVDLYIGGSEHATGHLLYSRFWNKFLKDRGYAPTEEPFKKLINQGMILGMSAFIYGFGVGVKGLNSIGKHFPQRYIISKESYDNAIKGEYDKTVLEIVERELNKYRDVGNSNVEWDIELTTIVQMHIDVSMVNSSNELDKEAFLNDPKFSDIKFATDDVYVVGREVEKMSKSKYNVVNPDDICEEYGADTLRLYEMFLGPLEQAKPWNTAGITGVYGFLKKLWRLYFDDNGLNVTNDEPTAEMYKSLHKTIKKVTEDIENFSFNTSVSQFMICVNELSQQKCHHRAILEPLAVLISPYAPHIAEELWSKLGYEGSISKVDFPVFEEKYLVESEKEYPVSFNGKMRFTIKLPLDLSKEQIQEIVLADERTIAQLAGNTPKNIIIVPGKIINLVG